MGVNRTGDGGNAAVSSAAGVGLSHRQSAAMYSKHQMRTVTISKSMVSGKFSIYECICYDQNMNV